MAIRAEDVGYKTRVFRITSLKLNQTLEMCVGKKYDHEGKDRYNVYRVKDDAVGGVIGFYEPDDSDAFDDDNDFRVQRFGEPTWTIESHEIPKETKPVKESTVPKSKSGFIIIKTVSDGDCFYDSMVRALHADKHDSKKIQELREEIATYIKDHPEIVIDHYKMCSSDNTLRTDSYYAEYWNMVLDDALAKEYREKHGMKKKESYENVIEMIQENEQENLENGKIDLSLFTEKTDPTKIPSHNDKSSQECTTFLKDYFGNKKNIKSDDEIIKVYTEHLTTKYVWADHIVISTFETINNIIIILLQPNGPNVESYRIIKEASHHAPNGKTRFVIVEYEQPRHYKLISTDKRIFTWSELPQLIKDKCKPLAWYKKINTSVSLSLDVDEPEESPLYDPQKKSKLSPLSPPYVPPESPKSPKGSPKSPEGSPKSPTGSPKSPTGSPKSPEGSKKKSKSPEGSPKSPEGSKKKSKSPEGSPKSPQGSPRSPDSSDEDVESPKKSAVVKHTREDLSKMTIAQLKTLLSSLKESDPENYGAAKTTVGDKNAIIECILDPTLDKCRTKKNRKGEKGGSKTLKIHTQVHA